MAISCAGLICSKRSSLISIGEMVVIPEPSTYALMISLLAVGFALLRRKLRVSV